MTKKEIKQNFARNLRARMDYLKINQYKLAKQSGVSQPQINSYLKGKHAPSLIVVVKIAQVLVVSVEDLVGGSLNKYLRGRAHCVPSSFFGFLNSRKKHILL